MPTVVFAYMSTHLIDDIDMPINKAVLIQLKNWELQVTSLYFRITF